MYTYDDYLMHYGVAGQRWGVRNYQNYDGTLTEEGRDHYGYGDEDGYGDGGSSATGASSGASANSTKASNAVSAGEGKKSFDKEKLKKAAIVGGAVAAAVLGTYGAYKLSQLNGQAYEKMEHYIPAIQSENEYLSRKPVLTREELAQYNRNLNDIASGTKTLNDWGNGRSGKFARNVDSGIDKAKTFITNTAPTAISNKLAPKAYDAGQKIFKGAMKANADAIAIGSNIRTSPTYQKVSDAANRAADNAALRFGTAAISARNAGNAGLDMAKRAGGAVRSAYNTVADKAGRAAKSAQLSATLGSTQRADNKFQARLNKVDNIYNDTKRLNKVDAAYRDITQKDLNRTLGPVQRAENRENARDLAAIGLRSNAEYYGNKAREAANSIRNFATNTAPTAISNAAAPYLYKAGAAIGRAQIERQAAQTARERKARGYTSR